MPHRGTFKGVSRGSENPWLTIGRTIDYYPGIYTSMKQKTILCLAAHDMNDEWVQGW